MKRVLILTISCLLVALMILPMCASAAKDFDYTVDNMTRYPIPKTYQLSQIIYTISDQYGQMDSPKDVFIDSNDNMYIADTGNDRIIRYDKDVNLSGVFFNDIGGKGLTGPEGIWADDDGGMFVANTEGKEIIHMSKDGAFVERFGRPYTDLFPEGFSFNPRKIYISNTGYIYTVHTQWLMSTDATNAFRGFIGVTQVGFDLWYNIRKLFMNESQKIANIKKEPASVQSFDIGSDGMIYTVAIDKTGQLKKLNSVALNIYPYTGFFGEMVRDATDGTQNTPQFVDVAVADNGLIYLLEARGCKVYIYNQEGENIAVFGGKGDSKDQFQNPVALDVDSDNNVYVLDGTLNTVKIFEPTYFMETVSTAIEYYDAGNYEMDSIYWNEVASISENYRLANKGIGKSLLKQGEYTESMDYYYLANDKKGYSNSFNLYRKQLFQDYFVWVVIIFFAAIVGLFIALKYIGRYIERTMKKYHDVI